MNGPGHRHPPATRIKTAFWLNLTFLIVEVVGGLLTNSMAILSDAVHDLGDTVTIGFSWMMEKISRRGRTPDLTFGYRRFSLAGALVSSAVLLMGSLFILSRAVPRLFHPQPVHPRGMLILAMLGVGVNGFAVLRLKGGGKLNERVIFLHLLEDVLGWAAILVVSIVLMVVNLPVLDPLLSLLITLFILAKIIPNLRETLKVFLQYSPQKPALDQIEDLIRKNPLVEGVHDLHIWSLDGSYSVLSCHVSINRNLSLLELDRERETLKKSLRELGIDHATIEIEPGDKICPDCKL